MAASLVLVAFLGLGALALDEAYRESTDTATRERLVGYVYALLGAAKEDERGRMLLPPTLPDPRFSAPDSGLYAVVIGGDGQLIWRSPSLLGRPYSLLQQVGAGERRFQFAVNDKVPFNVLNFGVLWEDLQGRELAYTFSVAENATAVQAEIRAFRRSLAIWLGGASLLLLLAQGAVLRWGLRPLRQVADDLKRIESGGSDYLQGDYPRELKGLTQRINQLIRSSRASRDRYRNSMGDLAHSLKTPLAVLQGASEGADCSELKAVIREQVPRMDEIIQYQLKRAAASGRTALSQAVKIEPVVTRLVNSLNKVYRGKGIHCTTHIDPAARFFGDESDLFELLGNLLENAFKYGRTRVDVAVTPLRANGAAASGLRVVIDDDGAGIPDADREKVLRRGERADQQASGQGIGLSVVDEIVRLYEGELIIGAGELGGARITVVLP